MLLQNVIISFPSIFTPSLAKGATEEKFSAVFLIAPTHPQLAQLQAEFNAAVANTYPSGMPAGTDVCFQSYDEKFKGKDYYDPRFAGWYALSTSAKKDDRPSVVDSSLQPIIDPSQVCSGMLVHANFAMSGYTKGKGGIGGWLNGIMSMNELSEFGRLDNKPSVEQMFAGTGAVHTAPPATTPAPAVAAAPTAPTPPAAPAAPAAPAGRVMTAKAGDTTYEQFIAAGGWTDELLISEGYMLPPGNVAPSFAG